jgi:hypothetical protein
VDAPLDLNELSRRLNIQRSTLEGMLQTLVRHGKLKVSGGAGVGEACSTLNCTTCAGAKNCPFVSKMPRTYELIER